MLCSICAGRAPFCPDCRAQRLSWHAGLASARGQWWATEARDRWPSRRWPGWDDSAPMRAIARAKVADLAGDDDELLDVLARRCADAAAQEYRHPAPRPGSVAFTV